MKTIKLIAVDIDGILLKDTFSPVLHNFVLKFGTEYTRDLERNLFSRPQQEAARYLSKLVGHGSATLLEKYFEERQQYLKSNDGGLNEGVPELLELLSHLKVRLVYYGGLPEEEFIDRFQNYQHYFERYICTNHFRPGIQEITKDFYGLEFHQVLFIDDVNTVAEVAKINNVPFIGIPSNFPWGFQRQDMIATKVKYLLNSVKEIDLELLERIDAEASVETIWETGEMIPC